MKFNIPDEHRTASGVYIIRNTVNEKVYVGSAKNLYKRHVAHIYRLKRNEHHSPHLQRFFNKHGADVLQFDLLELASVNDMIAREQKWMNFYLCFQKDKGYNIQPVAGSLAAFTGRTHTAESKQKMSAARKGKPRPWTDERKANHKPPVLSEASLEAMRQKLTGRKLSDETKAKIAAAKRGRKMLYSDEEKAARTERARKLNRRPEAREWRDKARKAASVANSSRRYGSTSKQLCFTGLVAEAAERRNTTLDSIRSETAVSLLEQEQYRRERAAALAAEQNQ
jgi:group I intron endonuclease